MLPSCLRGTSSRSVSRSVKVSMWSSPVLSMCGYNDSRGRPRLFLARCPDTSYWDAISNVLKTSRKPCPRVQNNRILPKSRVLSARAYKIVKFRHRACSVAARTPPRPERHRACFVPRAAAPSHVIPRAAALLHAILRSAPSMTAPHVVPHSIPHPASCLQRCRSAPSLLLLDAGSSLSSTVPFHTFVERVT